MLLRPFSLLPERVTRTLVLRAALMRRAMTLGVKTIVENDADGILLVRHTYLPGWHFPGGGVDFGESAEAAAVRELKEETGLTATGRPLLFGLYRNPAGPGRDHVALYSITAFTGVPAAGTDGEIAEAKFFPREKLPEDTSRATLARLAEIFDGVAISDTW